MEGVTTVMPAAISAGSILKAALPLFTGCGSSGTSEVAEAHAQAVENQARRQAEAQRENAQDQVDALRERGEKQRARARVGAATSGLSLSGSSLLSLESIQGATDKAASEVFGDAARASDNLLSSAADQARSIRLSGAQARNRSGGLDSLLRLGSQALGGFSGGGGFGTPNQNDFPTSFMGR
jgi:hypothetical protein